MGKDAFWTFDSKDKVVFKKGCFKEFFNEKKFHEDDLRQILSWFHEDAIFTVFCMRMEAGGELYARLLELQCFVPSFNFIPVHLLEEASIEASSLQARLEKSQSLNIELTNILKRSSEKLSELFKKELKDFNGEAEKDE